MMSIRNVLMLLAASLFVFVGSNSAKADLAFYDSFETGTIGANPTTPTLGLPWATVGATDNNTVQANPLVSVANGSAKVMQVNRASGSPAGREFFDLTPAQTAQTAAGQLLTLQFKHYQPDPNIKSIALLTYENALHNFTQNQIDLEFLGGRALKYYSNAINNFIDTGLVGTSGWDNVEVVIDYTTDKWSVSLNGGTPVSNLPFVTDGGFTQFASALFGPSSSPVNGFVDDVTVYVGAIPEPSSIMLVSLAGIAVVTSCRRRQQSK